MQKRSSNFSERHSLPIASHSKKVVYRDSNAIFSEKNRKCLPDKILVCKNVLKTSAITSDSSKLNSELFLPQILTHNSISPTIESKDTSNIINTDKKKYNSSDCCCTSSLLSSINLNKDPNLSLIVSNVSELLNLSNSESTSKSTKFVTPTHQIKKLSRPNSPSGCTRLVSSRSRIASIRRESDCSVENEAAHEKLVKTTQQVSLGFEDFCLDEKLIEERKRAKSLTEPISIFTNAFLPQSSSPSPTRSVDLQKQCYSPSTQQVVRSNISYSPSPSPTPSSPNRNRIMRSMSPIAVRQISKRRYAGSGNGSGLDSDSETSTGSSLSNKRQCTTPRNAASPLIRDPLVTIHGNGSQEQSIPLSTKNVALTQNTSSTLQSMTTNNKNLCKVLSNKIGSKLSLDFLHQNQIDSAVTYDKETKKENKNYLAYQMLNSNSNSHNLITPFFSKTKEQKKEQSNEMDMSSSLNTSSCSSCNSLTTQNELKNCANLNNSSNVLSFAVTSTTLSEPATNQLVCNNVPTSSLTPISVSVANTQINQLNSNFSTLQSKSSFVKHSSPTINFQSQLINNNNKNMPLPSRAIQSASCNTSSSLSSLFLSSIESLNKPEQH